VTKDLHDRAKELDMAARAEGISTADRAWLDAHLQSCGACEEFSSATERAIRSLHLVPVHVDPALVDRTRRAVHRRASVLRGRQSQLIPLWMLCALSWVVGGLTLPLVWHGINWVGQYINLPSPVGFLLLIGWWALPTLVVAVYLSARGTQAAGGR
jgi:predicted anti-sigma-YlaC factor YlaD